jgi:hypothetical protein
MVTTTMRSGRVVCDECATESDYHAGPSLDEVYRHGGQLVEDRESGRDLVSEMGLLSSRPEVLANALAEMGVGLEGDELNEQE